VARRELAPGEVKADRVDVSVPAIVGHDVIPGLDQYSGQIGLRDHRPAGLTTQQSPLRRVHDRQPPVGEEIDAHRGRRDLRHHLVASVHAERNQLVRAPGHRAAAAWSAPIQVVRRVRETASRMTNR
jgi:hypothetical protein